MTIMQKLGLVGLLGLAGCGFSGEEKVVQQNQGTQVRTLCRTELTVFSGRVKTPDYKLVIQAVDTTDDEKYDEIFVTRGNLGVYLAALPADKIARATTHYVVPGLGPDKQYLTGFPETKPMTPEYQAALGVVCREGNERWREK